MWKQEIEGQKMNTGQIHSWLCHDSTVAVRFFFDLGFCSYLSSRFLSLSCRCDSGVCDSREAHLHIINSLTSAISIVFTIFKVLSSVEIFCVPMYQCFSISSFALCFCNVWKCLYLVLPAPPVYLRICLLLPKNSVLKWMP